MKLKPDRHRSAGRWAAVAGVLLSVWLAGCVGQPMPAPEPVEPLVTPTAAFTGPVLSPTPPTPAAEGANDVITLTWWTPEFLSAQAPQPAGGILAQQLAEFERANDGRLRVVPAPKGRYGKGGLLDLLRTAHSAAPGILPDVVTLDVIELEMAVADGLLQPLDRRLAEGAIDGLYAFALSAGRFQGQVLAVQYVADVEHVAYLTGEIQTPPQTWDELLSAGAAPYLFGLGAPLPGTTTSRFKGLQNIVLSQYLAAGATVNPANRQPVLEEAPLLRLLGFYKTANDAGLLPPNALELGDAGAIWDIFAQGRVPMAQVSARRYLDVSESLSGIGFAAAPGWTAPAAPVADGWALAVVATNPERQQAAADLIAWLLQPENAGAMAAATGWLPTSPAALATWGRTPYYEFLDEQLAAAVSPPIGAEYPGITTQLQRAIVAVLSEGASPQDATAAALGPPR